VKRGCGFVGAEKEEDQKRGKIVALFWTFSL
jgi:hypothetical protein